MIITIDGPSGSGKSTVARKLAKKLGFIHVNQGAFFRAAGLKAAKQGGNLDSDEQVAQLVRETTFAFVVPEDGVVGLLVDGQLLSEELQSPDAGRLASKIAVLPKLRQAILDAQRQAVGGQSVVVEGRDAGTVGFPEADLKVYLDGRLEVRAERRFEELKSLGSAGGEHTLESITKEMAARDKRDSDRSIDPLVVPEGAMQIDTSGRSPEDIIEEIVSAVKLSS